MRAPSETTAPRAHGHAVTSGPFPARAREAVEHVILVDAEGQPSGTRPKHDVHGPATPFHLGFSCYLFRADGKVLITRRAESKRTWPGAWTNSCCGHPQLGETLAEAVRRRLRTELGIEPGAIELVLPDFVYRAEMGDGTVEHELCPVVLATSSDPVVPNPSEVADIAWVSWHDLVTAATNATVSPWCREQVVQLEGDEFRSLRRSSPATTAALHVPYRLPSHRLTAGAVTRSAPPGGDPCAPIRARVEEELSGYLDEQAARAAQTSPAVVPLVQAVRTLVEAGGKRLRPAFVYWGHRAAGADDDAVVRAGAAMELLHTFALLQDDVMDRSTTRRGRPTAHVEFTAGAAAARTPAVGDPEWFGVSAAILASDLAFVWADELLDRTALPTPALAAARRVFSELRCEVIYGQYLDLASARDLTAVGAEHQYTRMALLKSARYTVTRPLLLGAALASAGDPSVECALRRYGDALGTAFQLRDDVLGLFGDSTMTGKSACDDLREGKRTLLVLRALRLAGECDRRHLLAKLGDPDIGHDDAERCRAIVAGTGALASVERAIDHAHDIALAALAPLPAPARDALSTLATLASDRRT